MFRRLIAALFLFLPALPVFAAEDENEAVVIAAPAQTSAAESKITLPPCNDPALIAGVRRNLTAYYEANLDSTLIENRRRRLLLQNLSFFEPLDVASFNDKENYQVADRIIMAKINRGAVPEICCSAVTNLRCGARLFTCWLILLTAIWQSKSLISAICPPMPKPATFLYRFLNNFFRGY